MRSFLTRSVLFFSLLFGSLAPFLIPGSALSAAAEANKTPGRPAWNEGIEYLAAMLTSGGTAVDVSKLSGLLDFVISDKGADTSLDPGKRENATGAYFLTDIKAPLSKIVRYAYSSKIPAYVTLPSVIRLGGWKVKPTGPFDNLWEKVGDVEEPLVMRGVEYEEITPDLTTGGYYRYDMDRLMVLLNHRGRDFFLSVTRQKSPSTVGRKGAIIGPDADWNYFYSGQKGLNKTGLGWVSSYMYNAFSVSILFEPVAARSQTRCVSFKWLRAGWGGINMVKRENIIEGCRRFAGGFKKVLESPQLPEAEQLIDTYARIRRLPDQELITRLQPIGEALKKLCRTDPILSSRDFQEMIESGKYLNGMNREERENLLMSESVKLALNKKSFLDRMP
ncbi:MAG: hypothetical protein A4E73_01567 [Syntrophaceae bacterium PtaU1.Bin231]|nr:MAG: hypothetical protein A4E73_01567 [Syntrophaceae bacterium PtaU1.Bin231]